MNTKLMMMLSILAVLSILIVGCKDVRETTTPTTTSGDISEEEVAGELIDLDELEEQSNELDDVNFDEAEAAVGE